MMAYIRRYFISGLLVWVPILVTIFVIRFLADLLDSILMVLPEPYQPDQLLGFHVPGFGVLVILIVIISTGAIVANFIGSRLVLIWDALINRIPLVRSVYSGAKQVTQTLFTPGGQSFRKVFLVEYPRAGTWTLAFQTGDATPEVQKALGEEQMLSLFVPTTPNPTSGFLLLVPRKSVVELSMSVDQALKFVISLGVMQPSDVKKTS
jgi:uncharacterized membrane protein